MDFLRTPEARFDNLPGYPFSPHYLDVDAEGTSLRMHYLDEGPSEAPTVLLLHGEPTWSYLYRKMIPIFEAAGLRAVAPDLIGFGKSDKPTALSDYTYARHVDWVWSFLDRLGLRDINLVCQDWGSLIGLRLVGEHPDHFARVAVGNGFLPTGNEPLPDAFFAWRKFSQEVDVLPIGQIVNGGCVRDLTPEIIAAYDAPFPDETYKAGARTLPALVPASPTDPAAAPNRAAWEVLDQWTKPFLTAFSDQDPITRHADRVLRNRIPGTRGQPHTTIRNAGHFLQEDEGEAFAHAVVQFIQG